MSNHICILLCYNNYEHIAQCFDSIYVDDVDYFIIENKSKYSNVIQDYFSDKRLSGYIQFEENVSNNAVKVFLKDFKWLLERYEYITLGDCDLLVNDIDSALKEIKHILSLDGVGICAIDMELDNFPHHIAKPIDWLPAPIYETEDYIEVPTGGHMTTFKAENLNILTSADKIIDCGFWHSFAKHKLKWVKTKKNKAKHLTWDLYYKGNEYYDFRVDNPEIWKHERTSDYRYLRITPSQESIDMVAKISDTVPTFHHHYHILYDIARLFKGHINYVEIGCFAGGSACLMLQRPQTDVVTIDLGIPIEAEVAISNMSKFNKHNNRVTYLKGSSQDGFIISQLKEYSSTINILFIDGGHFYQEVIRDFEIYSPMVVQGGFIVFDDYNDYVSSPEVKKAVDDINKDDYEVIGTFENNGARPREVKEGNCFVIRKL